jgi:hypothetical protein
MRFAKLVTIGLMVGLLGTACNPKDFDTALDKAPVVSFDNESSSGSLFVLPLWAPTPGGTVAGRMLVSRKDSPYLALAEYDKDGKVTVHKASDSELSLLGNTPVNSAASLGPDGPIILGTPRKGLVAGQSAPGGISLLTLTATPDGAVSFGIQLGVEWNDHFGMSVAAGRVTDLAGTGEFVAVSDYGVQLLGTDSHVIATAAAVASTAAVTVCPGLDLTDPVASPYAFRPIAVGDVVAGGGEEIVLAGRGRVVFLQYDALSKKLVCLPLSLTQGAASSFGSSLAIADFDGDGNMDLAVGTPPDRVFVYFGPIATTGTPEFVTLMGPAGSSFGTRVGVFPMPAPKGAGLMVSDPSALAHGRSGAGKVVILNVPRSTVVPGAPAITVDASTVTASTLFDSSDDAPVGVFGDSLGSVQFDTRVCNPQTGGVNVVPWVSSGTSILTYFNYPGNIAGDLRCN